MAELVTSCLINKQIAGKLGLSEITVEIHRGHMMEDEGAYPCRSGQGLRGRRLSACAGDVFIFVWQGEHLSTPFRHDGHQSDRL